MQTLLHRSVRIQPSLIGYSCLSGEVASMLPDILGVAWNCA